MSFYELSTVQSLGLYLAVRNLTHFKIIWILFTINFIFPLFLLIFLITSAFLIVDHLRLSLSRIEQIYVMTGQVIIWHLARITIALILNIISTNQLRKFRQINV